MPWLVSAGAHVLALAAAAILLAMSPRPPAARVEISLVGGTGIGGAQSAARGGTRTAAAADAASPPVRSSARAASPRAPAGGAASAASVKAASGDGGQGLSSPGSFSVQASRTSARSTDAGPSANDVLNDTESASGSAGAQGALGRPDSTAQDAASGGAPGPMAAGTEWGWQGLPRRLVKWRPPEFPVILSALGQEVECAARITVAPSGIVTRVEITRSSGYIEIDASVADALRDYLFSKVDGRVDSTGTRTFRFRLEKQD